MTEIKHLDLGPESDYQPAVPVTPITTTETPVTPRRTVPERTMSKSKRPLPLLIIGVAVVLGVLTGAGAHQLAAKSGSPVAGTDNGTAPIAQVAEGTVKNGDVFGSPDEKTFKDSAEGYLEKNTSEVSEGTHRLVREGGESQTVYMISSVTDLDKFEGMQVKVWGETFKGQKAGWLMDVGRVLIVETQASAPVEE